MIVFRMVAIAVVLTLVLISSQTTLPVVQADPWTQAPRQLAIGSPPKLPDVRAAIIRDPFASHPSDTTSVTAGSAPPHVTTTVSRGPVPAGIPIPPAPSLLPLDGTAPYVPNPGGGGNAALPGGSGVGGSPMTGEVTVVATVVGGGNEPRALIANGSQTQVVGIGDELGGRRITRIVAQGIEFADGTRIAVESHETSGAPNVGAPLATQPQGGQLPGNVAPSGSPGPSATSAGRYPDGAVGSGSSPYQPGPAQDVPGAAGPQSLPSPVPLATPQDAPYTGTATLAPGQTAYPIIHYFSPPPGSPGTH